MTWAEGVGVALGVLSVLGTLLLLRHVSWWWARGLMDNGEGFGGWETGVYALVVDDDSGSRRAICRALGMAGFEPVEAESGEQAVGLLDTYPFRLAVIDICLPGMSGPELGWHTRRRMPDTVLVAVSAALGSWGMDDLWGLGFSRAFPKPFDLQEFLGFCRSIHTRATRPAVPTAVPRPTATREVDAHTGVDR